MPLVGQDNKDAIGHNNSNSNSDNIIESNGLAYIGAYKVRK
jgi:hypothetical protein